jgi:uncharacterized repeat protein (TIGR01451 family)
LVIVIFAALVPARAQLVPARDVSPTVTGTDLGNLVWDDLDNDGLLDAGESGLGNVTVELFTGDASMMLQFTMTDGNGFYEFPDLEPGSYIVRLPATNFNPGGVLRDYRSSTGPLPAVPYEPAPDPDADTTDSDDNGTETNGFLGLGGYIQSQPVTVTDGVLELLHVDFGVNKLPYIDLGVTKTDGAGTYVPGGTLTYTIVVTNRGPADADGMTVSDTRPAQIESWTWACAAGTPAEYNCTDDATNPATFTDTLSLPQPLFNPVDLSVQFASVTYTVTAQVVALPSGDLSNQVVAHPPPGITDLTPPDNSATDIDTLQAVDLTVTKTDNQGSYDPGGTSTYIVTITNEGPADANGLAVSDTRPAGISSWSWACANGTPPAYQCSGDAGNPATFTDSLDLPVLASVTYEVTAQIDAAATGDITNSVVVTAPSATPELDSSDNSASDTDTLAATTLSVTKTGAPDPVVFGTLLTYTIVVTNGGAANATSVTVTDVLPAGVTFESASGDGWTCGFASGTVTCTRPILAPGAAPPILVEVFPPSTTGELSNTATVSAVNAATAEAVEGVLVGSTIPTLSTWGLLLLGLSVVVAGAWLLRLP